MFRKPALRNFGIVSGAALCITCSLLSLSSAGALRAANASALDTMSLAANVTPTPTARVNRVRFGSKDVVSGRWVSANPQSITIQGFNGTQSLARAAAIRFYTAKATSVKALQAGDAVTLRTQNSASTVLSVTIAPPGNLYGVVFSFRGGVRRPTGTPPPGNFRPGARTSVPIAAGTIAEIRGNVLTLTTQQGQQKTYSLISATAVYTFVPTSVGDIHKGSQVGVTTISAGGKQIAIAVAESAVPNTTASLTAFP